MVSIAVVAVELRQINNKYAQQRNASFNSKQ